MRGIPILVPPLPEQKRIVTKLDKCFEAIDKARANVEKNLNNIKELVTSVGKNIYSSIGSANNQTIDELTDLVTDYVANGSFASLKENVTYRVEKSYAILIRLVDHSNRFEGNFVYIDKHSYDFLAKSKLEPNDIILSNVGARLGTVFKAPDLGMPMSLAPNSILLKSKDYGEYLFCWIKSKYGQKKIKNIVGGAGQPKFNKTDFKKIIVPMPTDKSEREEIVSKIYRTEKKYQALESNYQQELDALDELKKSILEKAFNGEL
jgi:type I restriction enzyme S subunit